MKKNEEKTRRVAIIRVYSAERYDSYGDYSSSMNVIQHVSNWQEVTDTEFWELKSALDHAGTGEYKFALIEEMDSIFACQTVENYRIYLKKLEEVRKKEQQEREAAAEEAKLKREAKKLAKLAKDRENFKKLAADMGLKVVDA